MDYTPWLEVIRVYSAMWANLAWGYAQWYFDVLVAFAATFAAGYAVYALLDRLLPRALGDRPRVWAVPAVWAAVLVGFWGGMDHAATAALRAVVAASAWPWLSWIWSWTWVLAAVWLAGCGVALFRVAKGVAGMGRAARRLPERRSDPVFSAALAVGGLTGKAVLKIGGPGTPVVSFGLFRAYVAVPSDFSERFSPDERFAMYLHECVHLRRRDAWKLLFLSLVRAVLWFDPVTRHAVKRVKADMERLCDWTVVRTHRLDPVGYAALVVKAASGRRTPAAGFSGDYRQVARRLGHILRDDGIPPPRRLSRPAAFGLLLGLLFLLAAGMIHGFDPDTPPTYSADNPLDAGGAPVEAGIRSEVYYTRSRFGIFGSYGVVFARSVNVDDGQ